MVVKSAAGFQVERSRFATLARLQRPDAIDRRTLRMQIDGIDTMACGLESLLTKVTMSQVLMRTSRGSMPVGPMFSIAAGDGADGAELQAKAGTSRATRAAGRT